MNAAQSNPPCTSSGLRRRQIRCDGVCQRDRAPIAHRGTCLSSLPIGAPSLLSHVPTPYRCFLESLPKLTRCTRCLFQAEGLGCFVSEARNLRTLAFADEGNSTPTARLKRKGIWTDSCTREPRNGAAGTVSPSELLCFGAFILRVSALVPQQPWAQSLLASSLVQGWHLFLGDGWRLAEPGWTLTLARGGVFSGSLVELGEGFCCSSSKDSVGVVVSPKRTWNCCR